MCVDSSTTIPTVNTLTPQDTLLKTNFPDLELFASGKVRDIYRVGEDRLLFVATDRISAFDYVLASGIPLKGTVLTQTSLFWFEFLKGVVSNHVVTAKVDDYPAELQKYRTQLRGRSMLVARAEMFPVECVARGYISGSAWKEYKASGSVSGIKLPAGLRESDKLPEPIFTPATKATTGHDENISFEQMQEILGADVSTKLRDLTLNIYSSARDYAAGRWASSWPIQSSNSANGKGNRSRRPSFSARFARFCPQPVQARRRPGILRQAIRPPIISKRSIGTNCLPPRRYRRKWWRRQARNT